MTVWRGVAPRVWLVDFKIAVCGCLEPDLAMQYASLTSAFCGFVICMNLLRRCILFWGCSTSSRCVLNKSCRKRFALCLPVWTSGRCIRFILMLATMCRVGEASHPGPRQVEADSCFVLGCCNPTGLGGKAPILKHQMEHADLWSFSETHLSSRAMAQFKAGLRFEESAFKHVVGGFPAPARAHSHVAGAYKGVAVVSKHITSAIPTNWENSIVKSSRVMASVSYIAGQWITAGTLYGEPESGQYPHAKFHNEQLLSALVSQICHMSQGPRYIAGDFNAEVDSLPSFEALAQAGFRELQSIAAERWGCPIVNTCKRRTRKDFFFISPELQDQLCNVQIIHDTWPDHSMIQGTFRSVHWQIPRTIWVAPRPFPWPHKVKFDTNFWPSSQIPVDEKYELAWNAIESTAASQCPSSVPKACMGRGKRKYTKVVKPGAAAPLKASRKGDIVPLFAGNSWKYSCWFRQARRLQAYLRHVSKKDDVQLAAHAFALWQSVLSAPGFAPDFKTWWSLQSCRAPNAPIVCPCIPPQSDVANGVFLTVLMAVRQLEKELRSSHAQYALMRRRQNPMVIFQDLKDEPVGCAEAFVSRVHSKVCDVIQDDLCLVLADVVAWDPEKPIFCGGSALDVVHIDHDCIWLASLPPDVVGAVVTQCHYVAEPTSVLEGFSKIWEKRWSRHADVPASQWRQILDFAHAQIPRGVFHWPSMTPADLEASIKAKKLRTSKGLDGVSIQDLRSLSGEALSTFCNMFLEAECTGMWPEQLVSGRITAIPKNSCPGGPDEYRPITILGTLYRAWGSWNARKALRAVDPLLPDGLQGSRPGCFAGQLWNRILWAIECSYIGDFSLCGLVVDLTKAFNFLPRMVTAEVLALLDALSCLAMVGINCVFHFWIQSQTVLCAAVSYVDDWQILTNSANQMNQVMEQLNRLVSLLDLTLDTRKSYCWATTGVDRAHLKHLPVGLKLDAKNLGAHLQMCRRHSNWSLLDRVKQMEGLWTRLQYSAGGYHMKVRALRMAAWPRCLHGVAATTLASQTFRELRTAAVRGINCKAAGMSPIVHLGLIENQMTDRPALLDNCCHVADGADHGFPSPGQTESCGHLPGCFSGPCQWDFHYFGNAD